MTAWLNNQQILDRQVAFVRAYLWTGAIALNGSGLVTLALSGNDPDNVLRAAFDIPRPLTGTFLGFIDNVVEVEEGDLTPVDGGGLTVPADLEIGKEQNGVTGELTFTNNRNVTRFVRLPGTQSPTMRTRGGKVITDKWPLLVIKINLGNPVQTYYEATFFYRGAFKAKSRPFSAKEYKKIGLEYQAVQRVQDDGCFYPPGQQTAIEWTFRIDGSGNNILVDPNNPTADIGDPSPMPFGAGMPMMAGMT